MQPAARRLWLVRHGETEGQSSIRFHGSNDMALSDVGREQVRALAPLLRSVPFTRIVHSPQRRAAESAAILAAAAGLQAVLHVEPRLREICFGACEGMTGDEIAAAFPAFWAARAAGQAIDFPNGEPRAQFAARVTAAIDELAAAHQSGDLLIVAHRGTVRHALRSLLAVPPTAADEFGVALASVTVLRADATDGVATPWQLEALGLLP